MYILTDKEKGSVKHKSLDRIRGHFALTYGKSTKWMLDIDEYDKIEQGQFSIWKADGRSVRDIHRLTS